MRVKRKFSKETKCFFELSRLTRTVVGSIDKQETLFVTQKGVVPFDLRRKGESQAYEKVQWITTFSSVI